VSVAAGTSQPSASKPLSTGGAIGSLWKQPATLLAGALFLIGLVGAFHFWFYQQHRFAMNAPADWSHAYLVPLISGFLIYKRRSELAAVEPRPFWPGLLVLVASVCTFAYFTLTRAPGVHMAQGASIIGAILGGVMLVLGPRMTQGLFLPIAFLVFGITVSEAIMNVITWRLQGWAAVGSYILLNALTVQTDLAGNTLTIYHQGKEIPLNVAEACSGMRMLIAFLALAAAVALVACPKWWQRIALMLLAAPVAIFTNILRVAFLGVAAIVNPDLSAGEAHTLIGTLWLVPAFALFMGVVWVLRNLVREGKPGGSVGGKVGGKTTKAGAPK
jgi:exosortase